MYIGRDRRPARTDVGQRPAPLLSRAGEAAETSLRRKIAIQVSGTVDKDPNHDVHIVAPVCTDDYFVELCALAGTGTLSPAEWHRLEAHLSHCASCRAIKAEYERAVSTTLPAMAANRANADDGDSRDAWSLEEAERALFERISRENIEPEKGDKSPSSSSSRLRVPLMGAVAAVLLLSSSYTAYRVGESRGHGSLAASNPAEKAIPIARVEPSKTSPPL